MTRGSGYLITDNYIYFHDEFNGDMYRDGHGESFILALDKTTAASYPHIITEWNKANHNYSSFKTYKQLLQQPDYMDDDDVYTAEDVRTNPIVKVEDGNN